MGERQVREPVGHLFRSQVAQMLDRFADLASSVRTRHVFAWSVSCKAGAATPCTQEIRMTTARSFSFVFALVLVAPLATGQEPRKPPKDESIMKKKLAAAQKLLGALAKEDFDSIKENAGVLNDLSKQAAWKFVETPRYEVYSEEFQRLTLKMANQAERKNLDGIALTYVDMTLTCVKCHQYCREQKIGRAPSPRSGLDVVGR
jgi:hypothetical protein